MKTTPLFKAVALLTISAGLTMQAVKAQTVISFETNEGFPANDWMPDNNFTGQAVPSGIVTSWTVNSGGSLWHAAATGGYPYEGFAAQSGTRYAALAFDDGSGVNSGSMNLDVADGLTITSFYWAWRGGGTPSVGGDSAFTVEYFDAGGSSLGTEQFYGGLSGGNPAWTLATVTLPAAQSAALSRVTFTGTPPTGSLGWFYLDTITLNAVPEPGTVGSVAMSVCLVGLGLWGRFRRQAA